MNLLMIILIVLAVWICAAICYFAWRVMPDVESPEQSSGQSGDRVSEDPAKS